MTIVNISDIIQDLDDIEDYVDAAKNYLLYCQRNIIYYPLDFCNNQIKIYSKITNKRSENLEYLMKGKLPLRDKFFSARNENIIYLLNEYKTFYEVNFTVANDGILKFVNDTNLCYLQSNGRLVIEYEGKNHSDWVTPYIISLLTNQVQSAFEDNVKLEIAEFALAEETIK